jgi:hypothetical protein
MVGITIVIIVRVIIIVMIMIPAGDAIAGCEMAYECE